MERPSGADPVHLRYPNPFGGGAGTGDMSYDPKAHRLAGETSENLLCILTAEGFRCEVWQYFPSQRTEFTADGDIDADGAYRAYHRESGRGLDLLAYAGHPGNWWGIVTHNLRPDGQPIVQGPTDPAPGYYI